MAAMLAPESIDAIRARKADHRTEASDLRLELAVRRDDALRMVEDSGPFLSRMEMVALEIGPTAVQAVVSLRALLNRHARQWNPEDAA